MPRRSLARLASVVPASPTNSSSESRSRLHSDRLNCIVRNERRTHTDIRAQCVDERIDAFRRRDAIGRIDADRRAARIVAVKAVADVEKELRLAPRARAPARTLGLTMRIARACRNSLRDRHRRRNRNGPRADRPSCAPCRPSRVDARVGRVARLLDGVLADRVEAFARDRAIQAQPCRCRRDAPARRPRANPADAPIQSKARRHDQSPP